MSTQVKPRIAIIDDDVDLRELVRTYFRQNNFEIECFDNAITALSELQCDSNKWDVVLVDLNLPLMNGLEFTTEAKNLAPELPIIFITTEKSASTAIEAIEKGAYDFIIKPINFPQLLISVRRALHFKNLQYDNVQLRTQVKSFKSSTSNIIGKNPKFLEALDIAKRVSSSMANIFISGESGTGKEIFAKYIHNESKRKKGPFIAINCSAIPENLLESELFGHAKGAFTGAQDKKIGLFEEAENGTLFLDEIGDLSPPLQAKLLRVVQERKIKRVGENQMRPINCRLISATHKNLVDEIKEKRFREDLYFRLNVIPIYLPNLTQRKEDIIPLADFFLKKFALENASPAREFSTEAKEFLLLNTWRGNVRELENCIERCVVLCSGPMINKKDFLINQNSDFPSFSQNTIESISPQMDTGFFIPFEKDKLYSVDQVINKYVEFCVSKNDGARDKTARDIGIDRKTLYKRLAKSEIN